MKKKLLGIVAIVAVTSLMAASLAACGSSNQQGTTAEATSATEATTKEETTTAKESTSETKTTEKATTKEETKAETTTASGSQSELPAPADELEEAARETVLDIAGHDKTIVSSEYMEGTLGGYTGGYYRIGVQDADGNITYYNGKADFAYTDEELATMEADGIAVDGAVAPPADELEEAARNLVLDIAGHDKTIVSSEYMEGTLGGYTGAYYRIGVQDADGNITYYNGKADFAYTDEELTTMEADGASVDGAVAPPADELEEAARETVLDIAGHDKTIVSSEYMEGTLGGYTGAYYRIGVQDADGNITYYNGKADFAYTDAELEEMNAN